MSLSGLRFAAFPKHERLIVLAFLLTITFTYATVSAQPRGGRRQPASSVMPLDPLTPQEKEVATRIASEDGRVKELLGGGRQRLIYVDFFALKPEDRSRAEEKDGRPIRIGRHAEVVFYSYQNDQGARVVVDLNRRAATEVSRLEGDLVPLTFDDLVEARDIALRNSEVRGLLGADSQRFEVLRQTARYDQQPRVEGLRLRTTDPSDPCYKQRCVYLLFRRGRVYLNTASVIVNLNSQTVRVERRRR
jgi:hypothetical protein